MRKYKHIFFDLDRTLWDFDTNSSQTLLEIISYFNLQKYVYDTKTWTLAYKKYNKLVWKLLEEKKLNKQELRLERFRLLFEEFHISEKDLIAEVSKYYIANSPTKSELMPYVKEVLQYLHLNYKLHIVSNGFYDIQIIKLKASGIDNYFEKVYTSDKILAAKPDKRIFQEAVKSVNAKKTQSIFIGDNLEKDIIGAKGFGMDQIWYNHDNIKSDFIPSFEIKSLLEIKNIL